MGWRWRDPKKVESQWARGPLSEEDIQKILQSLRERLKKEKKNDD